MENRKADILTFAPHPLDTAMGMGGTIYRWTHEEGKSVVSVVCTNGDKGSSDPDMLPENLTKIREEEEMNSASLLGIKRVIFLRHSDLGLAYTPEFREEIIRLVLEYRPDIVATCDPYERYISSPDHRITGQLVMDAVWPCAHAPNTYRSLLKESLQLHKVKQVLLWNPTEPNYSRDISAVFDTKVSALACHKSQVGPGPDASFIEFLTDLNKKAAQGQDYRLGEAFHRVDVPPRL
ncbi:MAG: PIG-L family deacetylase [Dehalococcoidales bacterium]|nr:PIG-L family deacetylase [Dehalococcoidales bacterium]